MTTNEERLRGWCMNAPAMAATLDEVLVEVRGRALEEAASVADDAPEDVSPVQISQRIYSLIHTPAPVSIPVEKVREVLGRNYRFAVENGQATTRATLADIADALGIPLDATQVHDEPAHDPSPHLCKGCDKPADGSEGHRFSCTVHGKRQVKHNADRGPVAVIPRVQVVTRDARDYPEMNACVSCGRDVERGRCVGCDVIGSECVCPVTP